MLGLRPLSCCSKRCPRRLDKNVVLLGKDNHLRTTDLGLVHSSAADTLITLILNRLRQDGDVEKEVSPNFLVRNWPAFTEWSTKSVRDAFFASPKFPKLLNPETVKETIARGVENGLFAYVGKAPAGGYEPFRYGAGLAADAIELSDEVYIVNKEAAEQYQKTKESPVPPELPVPSGAPPIASGRTTPSPVPDQHGTPSGVTTAAVERLTWSGEVPAQKWMNFYTKVLSKFVSGKGLRLTLKVEVSPDGGISRQRIEETQTALHELGLDADIETS